MTNLEALQSMTEYSNANLFTKTMTDRGVSPSGSYGAGNAQVLDLCLADIYLYLATHPEIREGALSVAWTPERLMAARRDLYTKWGLALPESTNSQNKPSVTGKPVTFDGISYPIW